jgi:hypothetical protein
MLNPKSRESLSEVIVEIDYRHYRPNRLEFQSLDAFPAMRNAACDFFAASCWLSGSFFAQVRPFRRFKAHRRPPAAAIGAGRQARS